MLTLREGGTEIDENHDFSIFKVILRGNSHIFQILKYFQYVFTFLDV